MKNQYETFTSLMNSFGYRYDLRSVFDDFLTMTICAFSLNISTGKSFDEELFLKIQAKYEKDEQQLFSKLLACLITAMEARVEGDNGNDVLGEFYEFNLSQKGVGQVFTPWIVCKFMGEIASTETQKPEEDRPLRIIDPCCGSGRMLLASAKIFDKGNEYYGIDIDSVCVKMTALNLFLNGIFHAEVMCADTLAPSDFRVSYAISLLPFGIFRITEKENSKLWHLIQEPNPTATISLISEQERTKTKDNTQLTLF